MNSCSLHKQPTLALKKERTNCLSRSRKEGMG